MKRLILILAAAIALGLTSVIAGGPKAASIAISEQDATSVTFTVTQQNYKNQYLLWVANKCSLGGVLVNAEYQAVVWQSGEAVGSAGPFETSGVHVGSDLIPVPWASDSCTAYVWEYPASQTPEKYHDDDVAVTFVVSS